MIKCHGIVVPTADDSLLAERVFIHQYGNIASAYEFIRHFCSGVGQDKSTCSVKKKLNRVY